MASTPVKEPMRHWQLEEQTLRNAIADDLKDKYINDLYPNDDPPPAPDKPKPPEKTWLESVTPVVDKIVPAIETILFVGGPYGLAASAGVGLIWAFLRPEEKPKKQTEVRESMAKACKTAIDGALRTETIRKAANSLKNFQDWLSLKQKLFDNVTRDDYASLEDDILNHLRDQVMSNGDLIIAFNDLLDTLGWFDDNHEQLLGLAVQSIFQAYSLRLASYISRGHEARCQGDWHDYNHCLGYVRDIIISLSDELPKLVAKVEGKLQALGTQRLAGVHVDDGGSEGVFGSAKNKWLVDDASKRRFHITGGRADDVMATEAEGYKKSYLVRLNKHLPHTPLVLRPFLINLLDQQDMLLSKQGPSNPMYAPTVLPKLISTGKAPEWPVGTALAYRYKLVDEKGVALAEPSPWTDWVVQTDAVLCPQFLIGDGYSVLDTTREIWVTKRDEGPDPNVKPTADAVEAMMDKITGHGIIQWPKEAGKPI